MYKFLFYHQIRIGGYRDDRGGDRGPGGGGYGQGGGGGGGGYGQGKIKIKYI